MKVPISIDLTSPNQRTPTACINDFTDWNLHGSLYRTLKEIREGGRGKKRKKVVDVTEQDLLEFEKRIVDYARKYWRVSDITYLQCPPLALTTSSTAFCKSPQHFTGLPSQGEKKSFTEQHPLNRSTN